MNIKQQNNNNNYKGIGFLNILTIIFVIAKLLKIVNWNWFIVFLPTIISISITVIVLLICLVICLIIKK